MAGETDRLVQMCREAAPLYDPREYDVVVASGEQVTSGLLAITLQGMGLNARSYMGWQLPIRASGHAAALIEGIDVEVLERVFDDHGIAVIPGFQGVTSDGAVATLGRGGSDTSAVALAAAMKADRCDIYTDVDGVYTTDPRIVPRARKLDFVTYEEMLELASVGAKVLQTRSVGLAMRYGMPIQVLSAFERPARDIDRRRRRNRRTEYGTQRHHRHCPRPQRGAGHLGRFARPAGRRRRRVRAAGQGRHQRRHDRPVGRAAPGTRATSTFTVPNAALTHAVAELEKIREEVGFKRILTDMEIAKVSAVGVGMRSNAGIAAQMFEALAERRINILAITTSEIKVSVLIPEEYTELAVRVLHSAFGLDAEADNAGAAA